MKKVPLYPITHEEVEEFKRLVDVWVQRLNITNWRVRCGRRRPAANLAEVEFFVDDMLARIHIGRDWGSNPPKEGDLEKTVIHELLHIVYHDLANLAEEADDEKVHGLEHAVINQMTEVIYNLSRGSNVLG